MFKKSLVFALLFICIHSDAQYPVNPVKPSKDDDRLESALERKNSNSVFSSIPAVNIGPTIMSGRVVDVAVNPENSKHFFVAYATGGVWETDNNGQSFSPIFDQNELTNNCGALAVDWVNKFIYVGTGEANSSRSSYSGLGLFKSSFSSGAYKWEHLGLTSTQHIGRVLIHPQNPQIILVAALGNLFSPSKERGVYKSTDGGKTWKETLFISENTGVIDIEMNPENPNQLIASAWEKSRRAWNFWECGPSSAIYISENGGDSWEKSPSFPSSDFIGRIGLAVSQDNVVYALIDNQETYEKPDKQKDELVKEDFLEMTKDSFLVLNDSLLNDYLKNNGFPDEHTAKSVKKQIRKGEFEPRIFYDYLYDSNSALFDKNVKGAEMFVSKDFGKSWKKTHSEVLEKVSYTYGYYFGTVQVNPIAPSQVYIAGVPLLKSGDGGESFSFIGGDNVHVDHHYIWINPKDSNHLINGNDGGINISYYGGKNWIKCNSPAVGQFYTVAVDQGKNYSVYGGLQDNGVWKGPSTYKASNSWHQEGRYPYRRLLGGDGMRIEIDDEGSVYTGYQFGHYYRIDKDGKRTYIHPKHKLQEKPLRWNWQTPILVSPHNDQIFYMGSNRLHRSMDRGETFVAISGDLTNGLVTGDVSYGTLTDISESPLKFGFIVTGSDDGKVFLTKDGGNNWLDISDGLPQKYWVKRVIASKHNKSRIYVVLNGHSWDNSDALLYCSDDYGTSWKRLGKDLPKDALNVIREDEHNSSQIYVGSDTRLYVSFDNGQSFEPLSNMPSVPIHDLAINKENNHLLVGTHGRSIYKIDLQNLTLTNQYQDSGLTIFSIEETNFSDNWGERSYRWNVIKPKLMMNIFTEATEPVELTIEQDGVVLFSERVKTIKGFNSIELPIQFKNGDQPFPSTGKYDVVVRQNNERTSSVWTIVKN